MDVLDGYGSSSSSSNSSTTNDSHDNPLSNQKVSTKDAEEIASRTQHNFSGSFSPQNINNHNKKRPRLEHKNDQTQSTKHIPIVSQEEAQKQGIFVRNDPHVRGNWAGLVYLDLATATSRNTTVNHNNSTNGDWKQAQQDSCQIIQQRLSSLNMDYSGPLVLHKELHISLTKTFYLQAGSLESFRTGLPPRVAAPSGFLSVTMDLTHIVALVNDVQTRVFFAWPVVSCPLLPHLVQNELDPWLQRYQQPVYYRPPLFHASFASMPLVFATQTQPQHDSLASSGQVAREIESLFTVNNRSSLPQEESEASEFYFFHVHCRLGDQVHEFSLGQNDKDDENSSSSSGSDSHE